MKRRKRVLVVDDEKAGRELLEALLTGLGHDVDLASNGSEALAKLDQSHDLVLLDVMMSKMDGFELARRIRKESPASEIPICMVTALSDTEQRLRAVEAGANDFIAKPIDKMELRIRTTSLLKAKEAQDAIKDYLLRIESQNHALQNSLNQLRKLSELKDEFLRIASHDLKNPLSGILGFATIIDQSVTDGEAMTEEMHGLLPLIINDARIMQSIITDFLDFQAMEDGEIKLDINEIDLNTMADQAFKQNAGYAEGKEIAFALKLAENLPTFPA
ncbi:hybrid sensor histidine kinase/response regulator, partial [Candidatus Sumerlaeota bacterium]|nr:hybrid sensor histidine kinase/response regulator [Candidatus Sumerlaeota bacterium]